MSNIILGFPNRVDTSVLSGGGWTNLTNLQDRNSYSLARSTDATTTNTQFSIDLGTADYAIKAISLHNHNLTVNATWRITVGTTAGASDVYDSGFVSVWSVAFDNDLNEFERGAYWSDQVADQNVRSHFSIIHTLANTPRSEQYFKVEINDSSNGDGYIEIGRLGVWSGFQPTKNASWGLQHGWEDKFTDIGYSKSGEISYEKRRAVRTANLSLDFLSDSEVNTVYEIMRRAGRTGEILYIPDPADLAKCQRYGFRGGVRQLGSLEKTSLDINSKEIQLREFL